VVGAIAVYCYIDMRIYISPCECVSASLPQICPSRGKMMEAGSQPRGRGALNIVVSATRAFTARFASSFPGALHSAAPPGADLGEAFREGRLVRLS
jgi:hypothetical protein